MTFLPIVERELRVAARRRSTYWLRLGMAVLAMVLAGTIGIFSFANSLSPVRPSLGKDIFLGLALLALGHALLSGRRSTADCLSEEKRAGTLGLLFLTDLKGYDVVLGKLAATSLNGFYGLLAVFPVMAIPLLMGGVTLGEVWRMILVLVDTILFALAVGIFVSVLSRDAHRAMGANFGMLLLLAAFPPAIAAALFFGLPSHPLLQPLLYSCPGYAWFISSDLYYRPTPHHFWCSLALIHVITWGLVMLTSWIAPRSWQDKAARARGSGWLTRWREWALGSGTERCIYRKKLLDINAFYWLTSRSRLKPMQVWCVLAGIGIWWVWQRMRTDTYLIEQPVGILTAVLLNTTLKVWIALETGQRLAEDQKNGALELLLSTPLTFRDILVGQFLALRRQFLKPLLLTILVELGLMFSIKAQITQMDPALPSLWVLGICMLLLDIVALFWVAMASALTERTPNQATILTVWRVLVLPWVLYALLALAASIWVQAARSTSPSWKFYLYLWFSLGSAADLLYGFQAWRALRRGFRELALRRWLVTQPKPA